MLIGYATFHRSVSVFESTRGLLLDPFWTTSRLLLDPFWIPSGHPLDTFQVPSLLVVCAIRPIIDAKDNTVPGGIRCHTH
eukprot:5799889-Pyramimonas_sp.AAC.2